MTIKEDVLRMIQDLPQDVTLEDIMHELYFRMAMERGLDSLDAGKGIPHEEVRERFTKWPS